MAQRNHLQNVLGELVTKANPYTRGTAQMRFMSTAPNGNGAAKVTDIKIEEDERYAADWIFKGQPHKINKAIRIEYQYEKTDKDGKPLGYMVTDYLLIGFEGSGGAG